METEMRTVVSSSNRGRYALDTQSGPDLTSGDQIVVYLGGALITGHVEHAHQAYYFAADDGSVCGLCVGMRVRRLE